MILNFSDHVKTLKHKLSLLDPSNLGSREPSTVPIVEAALWARAILEITEDVDLQAYGHPGIVDNIKTTHSVPDSDNPEYSKAVYDGGSVALFELLGLMLHPRYSVFNSHADGKNVLMSMSDRNRLVSIYFSDYLAALESLVLSRKYIALVQCDIAEHAYDVSESEWTRNESYLSPSINLFDLMTNTMKQDIALKQQLLARFFSPTSVPPGVLDELFFFQSSLTFENRDPSVAKIERMVIGFGPPWKDDLSVFSTPLSPPSLFHLIRSYFSGLADE